MDAKTALQILTAALNEALRIIESELDAGAIARADLANMNKQQERTDEHIE